MEYIMIVVIVLGGSLLGWTSASNMGRSPMDIPMIFHKISPMYFVLSGLVLPVAIGYKLYGFIGILAGLIGVWIVSVVVGSKIRNHGIH